MTVTGAAVICDNSTLTASSTLAAGISSVVFTAAAAEFPQTYPTKEAQMESFLC